MKSVDEMQVAPERALFEGAALGRYILIAPLGAGGRVFFAYDPALDLAERERQRTGGRR